MCSQLNKIQFYSSALKKVRVSRKNCFLSWVLLLCTDIWQLITFSKNAQFWVQYQRWLYWWPANYWFSGGHSQWWEDVWKSLLDKNMLPKLSTPKSFLLGVGIFNHIYMYIFMLIFYLSCLLLVLLYVNMPFSYNCSLRYHITYWDYFLPECFLVCIV